MLHVTQTGCKLNKISLSTNLRIREAMFRWMQKNLNQVITESPCS